MGALIPGFCEIWHLVRINIGRNRVSEVAIARSPTILEIKVKSVQLRPLSRVADSGGGGRGRV